MRISAVIIDLDGVLIDTESISRMAWMRAAREFGFEITDSFYEKIVGYSVLDARKEISVLTNGRIDMECYMDRSAAIYYGEMHSNGVRVMPGVTELLDYLRQHGLKSAIATSTIKEQAEWKLKKSGLLGAIDDVITGDRAANGKPAPDIFLIAAEQIGINPGECVVIEDAHAGIVGAKAAGMLPIMVPSIAGSTKASEELAYAVVPNLYGVIELLQDVV